MSIKNYKYQQPIVSQFTPQFAGPIVADTVVDSVNDLITIKAETNYKHRLVWVIEEESFYYLYDGNGTNINHWKKYISPLTLKYWEPSKVYKQNDIVFYSNILFQAKTNIGSSIIKTPNLDNDNWEPILGQQKYGIQIFEGKSIVDITINDTIITSSNLPNFTIYVGDFRKSNSGEIQLNADGSLLLDNMEIIDAEIKRVDPTNNRLWRVAFYENSLPKELSGYITYE